MNNGVAAQILKIGFVQALAFEGDQADGQAGGVKLQHHRRQRAGRKTAEIRHCEIGNRAEVGVGVCTWLKIDFDEAYAGKRTGFDVIHATGQGEKLFERVGDVRFNLLRRHAGIKCGDDHDGNVDRRKKINRHTNEGHGADNGHDQAGNNNEKWIFNREAGHQFSLPFSRCLR